MKGRGLALAELLLAVGMLAAILIMMVAVMGNGLRWQASSRSNSLAHSAGRDLLERIKEGGANGGPQLCMADVTGVVQTPIRTPGFASDPAWSPLLS